MSQFETYEYAGFVYEVQRDEDEKIKMVPVEGQHRTARKDRHIMNARDCYLGDKRKEKKS